MFVSDLSSNLGNKRGTTSGGLFNHHLLLSGHGSKRLKVAVLDASLDAQPVVTHLSCLAILITNVAPWRS